MRRFLFNLHLFLGLTLGIVPVVMGLTGSLLVFREEIEAAGEPHSGENAGGSPRSVAAEAVARVRAAYPDRRLDHVFFSEKPGHAHVAWMDGDALRVYIDPATGEIRGARDPKDSVTGWLFSLHTELLSGESGERVVGIAGFGLLFLATSGVVLWWPHGGQKFRDGVRVKWRASGKRINYDLHRAGGFYAAALLAAISLSGLALVYGEWSTATAFRMAGGEPPKPRVPAPPVGARPLPIDTLLGSVDRALPGGVLRRITFPAKAGAAMVVRKRFPGELHPNGMNYVYVDPYRGTVLQIRDSRIAPAPVRLLNLRYPLHIGRWADYPSRILHALTGLMPLILYITGFRMWWVRSVSKRLRGMRRVPSRDPVRDAA